LSHDDPQRAFALVGPGRAGTSVAVALGARGWRCVHVAGRAQDSPSVVGAAARLGADAVDLADAGRGASLVVVATPDAAVARAAAALAPGLGRDALVVHLSGALGLEVLADLASARPDVRTGSLHPLQSLPSGETGAARLAGSWCAVDGPPDVDRLALTLGMRPFRVDPAQRAAYHAAATVASNHLVALLGQVARLAEAAGIPPAALVPLVQATLDNVVEHGAAAALTGPVARGDAGTVAAHVVALPADERATYVALAREALRLSGRDDAGVRAVLAGVASTGEAA
jgi:predicted short-subunit dehydrogenase-like oxidoreductase (DUF2520 family)